CSGALQGRPATPLWTLGPRREARHRLPDLLAQIRPVLTEVLDVPLIKNEARPEGDPRASAAAAAKPGRPASGSSASSQTLTWNNGGCHIISGHGAHDRFLASGRAY